jgi:vacuolar protein sorting-associated protein 26
MKEKEICVLSFRESSFPLDSNKSIKIEVGIEDYLHIEFDTMDQGRGQRGQHSRARTTLGFSRYQLKDVMVEKIYLLLVCINQAHKRTMRVRRSQGSK